jgi:hypothetical protein
LTARKRSERSQEVRLAFAALLLLACKRDPELLTGHIVVRDAAGAVSRELRATTYGYLLKPERVRVAVSGPMLDAGVERFENGKLLRDGKMRVSMERSAGRVALFDWARAPLGQLVDRDGETWVYDAGGTPLGRAKTDADRVVLVDRDGEARNFVTGFSQHAAAALMLQGGLTEVEKALLALALDRSG